VDWKGAFSPSGLNWWTVVSGIGMNFLLTSLLFLGVTMLAAQGASAGVFTLAMAGGAFAVPLLTAYVCGRMSDERYLAYGLYSLAGFLILAVPSVLYAGLFGLLTLGFGILGALNGASLAARRGAKRRREIDRIKQLDDR
jgi:hypothetical protein